MKPLREVRRGLKPPLPSFDDDARLAFRKEVNRLELEAERLLMETLDGLAEGLGGASTLEALEAASAAWDRPAPAGALAELAAALK